MREKSATGELELLLGLLDEAYDRPAWHGPNLRGALRGLSAEAARWRPGPGKHCIWELALHCAYWKYAVRQRLFGGRRGAFPRKGSNWFPLPHPADAAAWKAGGSPSASASTRWRGWCGASPPTTSTTPARSAC
jgi:hypothetical protein